MADISPFAGLRYAADRVGDLASVLCPPYDVISDERTRPAGGAAPRERRAAGASARRRRHALRDGGAAARVVDGGGDPASRRARVVLRLRATVRLRGQRYTRRGFFAAVRLEPFERRVVLPHEKTLSAPKEDRRRLLRATRTQISPVFGLYRDASGAARAIIDEAAIGRARGRRDDRRRRSPSPVADHVGGGAGRPAACCSPTSRS